MRTARWSIGRANPAHRTRFPQTVSHAPMDRVSAIGACARPPCSACVVGVGLGRAEPDRCVESLRAGFGRRSIPARPGHQAAPRVGRCPGRDPVRGLRSSAMRACSPLRARDSPRGPWHVRSTNSARHSAPPTPAAPLPCATAPNPSGDRTSIPAPCRPEQLGRQRDHDKPRTTLAGGDQDDVGGGVGVTGEDVRTVGKT